MLCFYTCLSFCPQDGCVCLSACWDTTPWEQTPPGADTSQNRHPTRADTPQEQTPPSSRHPPRSRHLPCKQTPSPGADTPSGADPRPETAAVPDGTDPTGMHSCFAEIILLYEWAMGRMATLILFVHYCLCKRSLHEAGWDASQIGLISVYSFKDTTS